jgi:hypothetical protein
MPVMRQPGTNQQQISFTKGPDMIAHEFRTVSFFNVNKFNFRVVMPPVKKIGNYIVADAK